MFHIDECILYRNFPHGDILKDMTDALSAVKNRKRRKNQNLFFTAA